MNIRTGTCVHVCVCVCVCACVCNLFIMVLGEGPQMRFEDSCGRQFRKEPPWTEGFHQLHLAGSTHVNCRCRGSDYNARFGLVLLQASFCFGHLLLRILLHWFEGYSDVSKLSAPFLPYQY